MYEIREKIVKRFFGNFSLRCHSLRKMPWFHLISWCGNFVERQFPHNFARFARNCAFPQNLHTMKLGDIPVFYPVIILRITSDRTFKNSWYIWQATNWWPICYTSTTWAINGTGRQHKPKCDKWWREAIWYYCRWESKWTPWASGETEKFVEDILEENW